MEVLVYKKSVRVNYFHNVLLPKLELKATLSVKWTSKFPKTCFAYSCIGSDVQALL
jgi:hypothetical protein